MRHIGTVLALLLQAALPQVFAQPPKGDGKADTKGPLIGPEVLTDRTVTFRIYAPKASEASVQGDWMDGFEPVKLRKGKGGVWSATVGPLVPDCYCYAF